MQELAGMLNACGAGIEVVDDTEFEDYLSTILHSDSDKEKVNGFVTFFNYGMEASGRRSAEVTCDITSEYLKRIGFVRPETDGEYIGKMYAYMAKAGYIRK